MSSKCFSIDLPKSNSTEGHEQIKLCSNVLIIIGPNGSGKTRLGEWIEKNNINTSHRIGAQRSLTFEKNIPLKGYEQAKRAWINGSENPAHSGHDLRWGHDGEKYNFTTTLLDDYNKVLSVLIACDRKEKFQFFDECRQNEAINMQHPITPRTVIDRLVEIWESIFPHRKIQFDDTIIKTEFEKNGQPFSYLGREMSDGERVALYLIAQVLCVPQNDIVVIDEPEIHLHPSIMNDLWSALEKERNDCLFVYITHDMEFSARHKRAKKIWLKGYDGSSWDFDEVGDSSLPEDLLLKLLGTRKNVIFVEGTANSYDTRLYCQIFRNFYIVPCGGCENVISQTKAMNDNIHLHHLDCCGIIDRDYRSLREIENLKRNKVYVIDVAEVENLFLVEEVLVTINSILGFTDRERVDSIINYIVQERYLRQIRRQICQALVSEIKHRLSCIEITGTSEDEVEQRLATGYGNISYESIKSEISQKFCELRSAQDYAEILKLFNCKSLPDSVGNHFGLSNAEYCETVLRHISGKHRNELVSGLQHYFPEELQRVM